MINSMTISDLLLQIYSVSPEQNFFEHILAVFESYIPSTFSSYAITDLESGRFDSKKQHNRRGGMLPEGTDINSFASQHPFFEHYKNNNVGPVISITDFMSEEEWKNTTIYKALHQKYGTVHDTSVRFYDGSQCVSFCFSDPLPMSMENRRLLTLLAPHLGNAYRMYRLQKERGPGGPSGNMILLSASGKMEECLPEALALMDTYYPHRKESSIWTLPEDVVSWIQVKIETLNFADCSSSVAGKLKVRHGSSILLLSLHKHGAEYLLLLEEIRSVRGMDILMDLGLTPREAVVTIWMVQGKKNNEIAAILGISTATIRKHVENILRKLECETRGMVAQLVMQAVTERIVGAMPGKCATCTKPVCTSC